MNIDHAAYQSKVKKLTLGQLLFTINDCKEAIEAFPDNPKAGYYADEICYCAQEIQRRNKKARKEIKKLFIK